MITFHPHLINYRLTSKDKNLIYLTTNAKESPSICSHHHCAFVSLSEVVTSSFNNIVMRNTKIKKKVPSGLLRQEGVGLSCTFISL